MTPETENEQLRTRLAEMAAEVERLQSVIDVANAQKSSFYLWQHKSGKFAHGFYECEEHAAGDWKSFSADGKAVPFYARPIPAQQSPRTTEATIPKGFVLWPENVTFDMISAYESAILAPIGTFSGEGYLRMLNVVKSQFNNPLRSESSQHSQRVTEQDAREIVERIARNIPENVPDNPMAYANSWALFVLQESKELLDKLNGVTNAQ